MKHLKENPKQKQYQGARVGHLMQPLAVFIAGENVWLARHVRRFSAIVAEVRPVMVHTYLLYPTLQVYIGTSYLE